MPFYRSEKLKKALAQWLSEGIVSEEQAKVIALRHSINDGIPWYKQSKFIISVVGLLIVFLGLVLLISANWNEFPVWMRVGFGIIPLILSYLAIYLFNLKEEKGKTELAAFFGSLIFGANIFLQAQIFHISGYFPDGLLLWIIGCIPLALILKSSLLNLLTLVLFCFWSGNLNGFHDFEYLEPLVFAILLYQTSRNYTRLQFLALIAGFNLMIWSLISHFSNHINAEGVILFTLIGIISILIPSIILKAKLVLKDQEWNRRISELLAVIPPVFFSFQDFAENGSYSMISSSVLFVVLIGLFLYSRKSLSIPSLVLVACSIALGLLGLNYKTGSTSFLISLVANISLAIYAIWNIQHGISIKNKGLFMWGLFLTLLLALIRYIDFFENYWIMGLIFIGCGLIILFLNNYWDKKYGKE